MTDRDWTDPEERFLMEQLRRLHEQYLKDAKPYTDRLAAILAMRPPRPMILQMPDPPHNLAFLAPRDQP